MTSTFCFSRFMENTFNVFLTIFFIALFLFFSSTVQAQNYMEESRGYSKTGAEIIKGNYMGLTEPLTTYREDPNAINEITKSEKIGYHPKDDWILNKNLNPNARPKNGDPIRQKNYTPPSEDSRTPIQSFGGIGNTSVNPSDPAIDVGPNHVIQMVNGCLLYTSPSPRDATLSRMPSSA